MIFVTGTGRSGTSAFYRYLASDGRFSYLPEFRYTVDPGGCFDFVRYINSSDFIDPYGYTDRVERLLSLLKNTSATDVIEKIADKLDSFIPRYKLSPAYSGVGIQKYLDVYRASVTNLELALCAKGYQGTWIGRPLGSKKQIFIAPSKHELLQIMRNFLNSLVESICADGVTYCEKNTWNFLYRREIEDFWPCSRFIVVYRHPDSVVRSFMAQRWAPSSSKRACQMYSDLTRGLLDVFSDCNNV